MTKITILGRGMSLNDIEKIDIHDKVILVNSFTQELQKPEIFNKVSEKDLTHFINRGAESILPINWYAQLPFNRCQLNIFKPEYDSGVNSVRRVLDHHGIASHPLPEIMEDFCEEGNPGGWPTTGMIAVTYSSVVLKADIVDIAGVDFYESDYLVKPANDHQRAKGKRMKVYLEKFISSRPSTHFRIATRSSFSPDLDNLEIL